MSKDIFEYFPDVIDWIKPTIKELSKVGSFLVRADHYEFGMTRCEGEAPDMPEDATWVNQHLCESPYDGKAFLFQLNLEEIPDEVRKPEWPTKGMVWAFIDLSEDWEVEIVFDERSAKDINWKPNKHNHQATAFHLEVTVPDDCHPELNSIAYHEQWSESYYEWKNRYADYERISEFQVGGWIALIQGSTEANQKACVCEMQCPFVGDAGSVYLFYTPEKGFYATVETC